MDYYLSSLSSPCQSISLRQESASSDIFFSLPADSSRSINPSAKKKFTNVSGAPQNEQHIFPIKSQNTPPEKDEKDWGLINSSLE